MTKKQKYYVVWRGKNPGVYDNWDECKEQITGYKNAQYKSFSSLNEAKKAFDASYEEFKGVKKGGKAELSATDLLKIGEPNYHSISVDAASSGNPGKNGVSRSRYPQQENTV